MSAPVYNSDGTIYLPDFRVTVTLPSSRKPTFFEKAGFRAWVADTYYRRRNTKDGFRRFGRAAIRHGCGIRYDANWAPPDKG